VKLPEILLTDVFGTALIEPHVRRCTAGLAGRFRRRTIGAA